MALAVLGLPTLLVAMDFSVLYLAVPHLSADIAPSGVEQLWILDIYGFLIAGFLVTMGTLGDRIGRKKLLLIGAVVFGIASVPAITEALRCKEEGRSETILFGLSGHGFFDLGAYQAYLAGELRDDPYDHVGGECRAVQSARSSRCLTICRGAPHS